MENDSQTIQNNRYSCLDKMSVKKILIQNIQLVNQNVTFVVNLHKLMTFYLLQNEHGPPQPREAWSQGQMPPQFRGQPPPPMDGVSFIFKIVHNTSTCQFFFQIGKIT
jgi:hypothetical protein